MICRSMDPEIFSRAAKGPEGFLLSQANVSYRRREDSRVGGLGQRSGELHLSCAVQCTCFCSPHAQSHSRYFSSTSSTPSPLSFAQVGNNDAKP